MGLLGDSWDDPSTQATIALASGLLGPGGPGQQLAQGMGGAQQAIIAAKQRALDQAYKQAQTSSALAQASLAEIQAKAQQAALDRMERIRQSMLTQYTGAQGAPQTVQPQALPISVALAPEENARRLAANQSAPSPAATTPGLAPSGQVGLPAGMPQAPRGNGTVPQPLTGPTTIGMQVPQQLMATAQIYAREGEIDASNKLLEQAVKLMPEVKDIGIANVGGKLVQTITMKDGSQRIGQLEPAEETTQMDLGGTKSLLGKYTGTPVTSGKVTNTPYQNAEIATKWAGIGLQRQQQTWEQGGTANAVDQAFQKDAAATGIKDLGEYADRAQKATNAVNALNAMKQQLAQGIYTGGFANAMLDTLNKVGIVLPASMQEKISRTQVFDKEAMQSVAQGLKTQFGARPAAAEFMMMLKANPNKELQPAAIAAMIEKSKQMLEPDINDFMRAKSYLATNKNLIGFQPSFRVTPMPGSDGWSIKPVGGQ